MFIILALLNVLSTLLILITPTTSLGINCRGKSECNRWMCVVFCDQLKQSIPDLKNYMENSLRDGFGGQLYLENQLIACIHDNARKGAFCAFYQKIHAGTLYVATRKLRQLDDHGCHLCGSAPLIGNNIDLGEVTVNFIKGSGHQIGCREDGNGMCTRNASTSGTLW